MRIRAHARAHMRVVGLAFNYLVPHMMNTHLLNVFTTAIQWSDEYVACQSTCWLTRVAEPLAPSRNSTHHPLLMSATRPGDGHHAVNTARTGPAGATPAPVPPGRLTLLIDSRLLLGPLGELSLHQLGLLVRYAAYEVMYGTPSTWDPDVEGFNLYLNETPIGWHIVATELPQPDF